MDKDAGRRNVALKKTLEEISKTGEHTKKVEEQRIEIEKDMTEIEKSIRVTEKQVEETNKKMKKSEKPPAGDHRMDIEIGSEDHCGEAVTHAKNALEHAKEAVRHAKDVEQGLQGGAKVAAHRVLERTKKNAELAQKLLEQALKNEAACHEAEKQMRKTQNME